jgi:hypothetical protein
VPAECDVACCYVVGAAQDAGTCYWQSTFTTNAAGTGKPFVLMTKRIFNGPPNMPHKRHVMKIYRPNHGFSSTQDRQMLSNNYKQINVKQVRVFPSRC